MKTLTYQLRKEQGLSSKQLASKALVTDYTIQVLEGRYPKYTVEPNKMHQVANALGVSMEVLLGKKTRREEELEKQLQKMEEEFDSCKMNLENQQRITTPLQTTAKNLVRDLEDAYSQNSWLRLALLVETIILSLIILL